MLGFYETVRIVVFNVAARHTVNNVCVGMLETVADV